MAFHKFVISEQKQPADPAKILKALEGMATKLETASHHVTVEDRSKNIAVTSGLIQKYFVHKEPPLLGHGVGLAVDFENSLRRSRIETPRYEFKQGLLRLSQDRTRDDEIIGKVVRTACAIANIGPESKGYIYLGVADKESDAERIKTLDGVIPVQVDRTWVVGIDREARIAKVPVEQYVRNIIEAVRKSDLSENLKAGMLSSVDTIVFRGMSVIRFSVTPQSEQSWVGDKTYIREGSETVEATGKKIAAIASAFRK